MSNTYILNNNFINNRGLAYADGFFTTIGVYKGHMLWLDYHQERLISHADRLQLTIDPSEIVNKLRVHAQIIDEGILKAIVNRKAQNVIGYGYDNGISEISIQSTPKYMPSYHQLNNQQDIPIQEIGDAVCLVSQISCLPRQLAGLKSLNRLDNVLASGELQALRSKYDYLVEGLVTDINNEWIEGTSSNIFYQLSSKYSNNQQWYTPPIIKSGVDGIMKQILIDRLKNTKNPIKERPLNDQDLVHISCMFFSNAVRGVMPINKLWLSESKYIKCQYPNFNTFM